MKPLTTLPLETVLLATGTAARYTIYRDTHNGKPYAYTRNVNNIWTRTYLVPGGAGWVEAPEALAYYPTATMLAA